MDKAWLCEQLKEQLRTSSLVAQGAAQDAAKEARFGATAGEKRADARVNQEYSNLARAQHRRAERAQQEIRMLARFSAPRFSSRQRVALGALVEVEDEDEHGRTLFLAPVGAGITLTGPGGDGFLSVVTPASPLGRAVLGRRVGESFDVTVRGEPREWTVTYLE